MHGESPETTENPKLAAWKRAEADVEGIVDKLGRRVDPGIKETVVAFRALGLSTDGSCEGHLDRKLKAPWVDIGEVPEEVSELVKQGWKAGGEFSDEQKRLINETVSRLNAERKRMQELLDEFYRDRKVPFDRRLILDFFPNSARILSQGAGLQDDYTPEVQSEKLKGFQEEMEAFTGFLKESFLERAQQS